MWHQYSGGAADLSICSPLIIERLKNARAMLSLVPLSHFWGSGPYTSPISQLNISNCVPVRPQLIPLTHSQMLKLS